MYNDYFQPPEPKIDQSQNSQISSTSTKEDQAVPKDDYEKVKEESQVWKQKFQAKSVSRVEAF